MTSPTLDRAMSEEQLLDAIVQTAKFHGWLIAHFRPALTGKGWRTPMQGDPGFPDLLLARKGRILALELKRQSGKTTPSQDAWLSELSGPCGNVTVEVVRPSDLDEVLRWLR